MNKWRAVLTDSFLGTAIALTMAGLAYPHVEQKVAEEHSRRLGEVVYDIQLAIERYAVDNDGYYPASAGQLQAEGYLGEWPKNPNGKGRVSPLKPGEPWEHCGFVYIPSGRKVPAGHQQCVLGPQALENYMLVVYTPRPHGSFAKALANHKLGQPDSQHISWLVLDDILNLSAGLRQSIDWTHVDLVISSGADYFTGCKRAAQP